MGEQRLADRRAKRLTSETVELPASGGLGSGLKDFENLTDNALAFLRIRLMLRRLCNPS
jgi:hypothetical protein